MRIALVGPELEENLALRYLHASLISAGHESRLFDFHSSSQVGAIAAAVLDYQPGLVGLSMVFTARAREFLAVADTLRAGGYRGHITAGGHFASFHADDLLGTYPCLDTIIHGEGERTLVSLAAHIASPGEVANVSFRGPGRTVRRTAACPNNPDLDSLPWPTRTPPLHTYLGLPIANVLGGRGCFGNCNFCSIAAWHKENGGARFRFRSPSDIADEMAHLYHDLGVRVFNFHDDNFFCPKETDSLRRFTEIRRSLRTAKVGRIGIQIKARPDSISAKTVEALEKLGLFRVFLGVESNAVAGLKTLGRGIARESNYAALEILRGHQIHTTFNLLMFDPEMTPGDLRDNIAMLTAYGSFPLNFGRVEVYTGTPLEKRLRAERGLRGDYFGYTYTIKDPRMQQAFELFRTVFTGRNFEADGMNHTAMRLDYYAHLLRHFHDRRVRDDIAPRTRELIAGLNGNSAALLGEILDFVVSHEAVGPGRVAQFGNHLLRWREAYDRQCRPQFLELIATIESSAAGVSPNLKARAVSGVAAAAAAAVVVVAAANCDNPLDNDWHVSEMIATPTDTLWDHADTLAQFEANDVSSQIRHYHGDQLRSLARQHELRDTPVRIDLLLDSAGAVVANRISMPDTVQAPAFSEQLAATVATWSFDHIGTPGMCTVMLTVETYPYPSHAVVRDTVGWHVCEVIAMPPDSSAAKPVDMHVLDTVWNQELWESIDPFDSSTVTAVRRRIDSLYVNALRLDVASLCADQQLAVEIDMVLDAFGNMTMFRIGRRDGAAMASKLESALSARIATWEFPCVQTTVARAGTCAIALDLDASGSHYAEMIPIPMK